MAKQKIGWGQVRGWLGEVIGPDGGYLRLAMVYGIAISLLSLATPISVQLLINSVAKIALPAPLITLSALLFTLLLIVVILSALRVHIMALFERRIFARTMAEITIRAVHARNPFFADARRVDLFNRYFDLMTVQKSVPSLVIGGFTILLQSVVGLVVTSFYHPFFLGFNVILIALVWLIWQLWSPGAIRSAVALSHAKHDAARWLEGLGTSNGFYKSSRHLDFAMDGSETMTAAYVAAHRRHFRFSFTQTCAYLLLYATASAALLAMGGWLILQGQLSIGQLVAAELILSGVFYGLGQLGTYLDAFYDMVAAAEEVSLLYAIPHETHSRSSEAPGNGEVRLREVEAGDARIDLTIPAASQLVVVGAPTMDSRLAMLLKRNLQPDRGLVMVGGVDLEALDVYRLRSDVIVLDRPTIVEISIRDYLGLAGAGIPAGKVLDALALVGLDARIGQLPEGMDTPLAASGYPLSIGELMALKLANALLARPRVLLLGPLYDLIPPTRLTAALDALRDAGTTVLLFTGRPEAIRRDGYLWLGKTSQARFETLEALRATLTAQEAGNALQA
ncbi:ABC transporter ATP-binding protein [Sphingomonas sp. ABOLD]|uniref:Putative ABC transport system ATP-binding protein n=1 Tax=Sphingomonas trueperi TaxID=53317 RepID=A0A7X5Y2B5_9SPHN|nr:MULTISPECIES: ABC transporter ATP-binding protein [Sphingomonas]NJB99325.1 putative ABC transport system ATP-binding protein [Sphingomonas trueperi]RSV48554.1 ABC transporter ATP-binding protein [Sphingomonas sp. ABOLD]